MKLQNLTVIFIIIIIPIILLVSLYISTGLKTINYQSIYDTGLLTATHDAIYAFEINTSNDEFSDSPEVKRSIIKSSIKMFERSLANTCRIPAYNFEEIEEYIPAIVFGMYDGFYMYAPSVIYNGDRTEYKHNLKNYVYYSEILDNDMVIIYSLDNYVTVSGDFGNGYEIKEGYLAVGATENGKEYQGIEIVRENISGHETDAINYYKDAYAFTKWFNEKIGNVIRDENNRKYLYIDSNNDPENENSMFVQHKRKIIKNKIESVLNSSITAYSARPWRGTYKMPKLSEEDWQKIYNNISMITFFQGKRIGLTNYNGYCVLNSTNSNEYVNPNLMYFIDNNGYYHDIRCEKCEDIGTLTGYKIGNFAKKKIEQTDENGNIKVDQNGNTLYQYTFNHNELACYYCVNGQIDTSKTAQEYVYVSDVNSVKTSYWTSLARERYNQSKLLRTDKQIVQWEQTGTRIYGKDSNGNTLITLKVGDYINYDCTNGGKTYSYTSPSDRNGARDQTFSTRSNMKWRLLGVESNQLIIVSSYFADPRETLTLKYETGYGNGVEELNKISQVFGHGKNAVSSRCITASDAVRLLKAYGKDAEDLDEYGNRVDIFRIFLFEGESDDSEGARIILENCQQTLIDILFPNENYMRYGIWFATDYYTSDNFFGLYNTYGFEDYHTYYALYASHLFDNPTKWPNGRTYGIRPVITLKTNIQLEKSGTYDGCTQWNIK